MAFAHRAPLNLVDLIDIDQQTIPALLTGQAEALGHRVAFRCGRLERTYSEVRDAAANTAAALTSVGITAGDRIAAISSNRVELLDLILGCMWIGAIAVPINTAARGAGLRHVLRNSGARNLLVEAELLNNLEAVGALETLDKVWVLGDLPGDAPGQFRYATLPRSTEQVPAAKVGPGDTAAILYTSGTTGPAKGVCCPHAQFYWWAVNVGGQLQITERDTLYTSLPLFHTNALTAFFQSWIAGATYTLGERFSASRFWQRVSDSRASLTYLLGAMVNILLAQPDGEFDRAHSVTRALAPATPANLWTPFKRRFGVQVVEGYGSTETNGAIGVLPHEQRPGYMGRVRRGFDARVVDENDSEVPDGGGGELLLRPDKPFSFARGYWQMDVKTVEAWRNLWFHTGDLVIRDADGWFRFSDRLNDSIRRRGENVSSFEVEQVVLDHPAIAAVAAFAVPSELAEDEVMVAIVLEEGAALDYAELMRFCEPRMAYFAIPRYAEAVDELPLTENGKVRKSVLRDRGIMETTWDREAAGYRIRGVSR